MIGYHMFGYGDYFFGGFFMMVFWVLVIVGIVYLIQNVSSRGGNERDKHEHESTALEILQKRYANGEINKEEYEQIKNDISEGK